MNKKILLIIVLSLSQILIVSVPAVYFYRKYTQLAKSSGTTASGIDVKAIAAKVGKLVDVPAGEDPTIATITDTSKLTGQYFYAKAKNGDIVLLYQKAQRAILYDPKANKVMEMSQISLPSPTEIPVPTVETVTSALPSVSPTRSPTPSLTPTITPTLMPSKIYIYNGTGSSSSIDTVTKKIKDNFPSATIIGSADANKKNYETTYIVDLKGTRQKDASELALKLSGIVANLPSGESEPSGADIVVITGQNNK
jgi:hypothetical protein